MVTSLAADAILPDRALTPHAFFHCLQCRFKHTRLPGPPPEPAELEAAKPAEFRNITIVANQANEGISAGGGLRRFRAPSNALALQDGRDGGRGAQQQREPRERQAYQRGPQHSSVLAAVGQQGNPYGF